MEKIIETVSANQGVLAKSSDPFCRRCVCLSSLGVNRGHIVGFGTISHGNLEYFISISLFPTWIKYVYIHLLIIVQNQYYVVLNSD